MGRLTLPCAVPPGMARLSAGFTGAKTYHHDIADMALSRPPARQTWMHSMQTAPREDYAKQATSNGTAALNTPSGLVSNMANIF